jgi:glutamyl-tRNA synthetase
MAPSPTGLLHIGTARTTLFNWLFTKHHAGKYILRIEDTDKVRSTPEFEKNILEGFEWLGLKWDEIHHQSERTKYYSKYIQKLLDEDKVFWCYHTKEELEAEQKEQYEKKEPPRHVCEHKFQIPNDKFQKENGIIRLRVDTDSDRKIIFDDIIKGKIEFEERLLGDFSIAKNIDEVLYNFAVIIDDHMMEISHVIRGEDHIANTPKQILIYEALGWDYPKFAHLPLILGQDKSKMSKRHGATSISDYKNMGYLPDAIINFLAILGWSPDDTSKEFFTKNEIIEQFSLEKIHKSGAIFDIKKLNWLNQQYIRLENDNGLYKLVEPFIKKYFGEQEKEKVMKMTHLFRERLEYLDQVGEYLYFFKEPEYDPELLVWKKSDKNGAKISLEKILDKISGLELDSESMKSILDSIAEEHFEGDRGSVYWPLRVALSGQKYSADPIEIAKILSKEEIINRITNAIKKLET